MNLKKLAATALSACMLLSMTACGGEAPQSEAPAEPSKEMTDWDYIQEKGSMKIGFTYYEPMNYTDDNGEFVGFETEFAKAVCEKIGVEPEFVEINWDGKVLSLQSKDIDVIWNGMTITPEISESLTVSDPYLKNYQVIVIRKENAEAYKGTADLVGKNLEAEAGSAGEAAIAGDENLSKGNYLSVTTQTDALLEVKTGAADAAVMDFVLADTVVGNGDYSDLMVIPDLQLSVEEYAAGFRKDSPAAEKMNAAMKELIEEGKLNELAVKYGLGELLLSNQK